jgi:nitric oxide reductase activation protein
MVENHDSQDHKDSLAGLAKKLTKLSPEQRRAALETSAALAGVSLRVSREFVEAVPAAAKMLSAEDIRLWGELGRRLAMGSAAVGSKFFGAGVEALAAIPEASRHHVFEVCTRQLVLSSAVALETFALVPEIAAKASGDPHLEEVLRLAGDIAARSAKHSADFLRNTPAVLACLNGYGRGDEGLAVAESVFGLASNFAVRTGGMTADLWLHVPESLANLDADSAVRLIAKANVFLESGGTVTMHFLSAGPEVLRRMPEAFEQWCGIAEAVGRHGSSMLIQFFRLTPRFVSQLAAAGRGGEAERLVGRVLELVGEIAATDGESAIAAFRSSAQALKKVSLAQFEEWVETGLREKGSATAKARRSYFALETRQSNEFLQEAQRGLPLDRVQTVLRIYIEALTGKEVEIAPLSAMPQESRIGDGKTIYLPSSVDEFDSEEMDFRLYKVLAAHGAGQIEFGTFAKDSEELKAAYTELSELYSATAEQTDAFSLAGYIEDVQSGKRALTDEESRNEKTKRAMLPKDSDYHAVLAVFPEPRLAKKIFGTMENARIDAKLRKNYRGLRKDLDLMREFLREHRPYIFDVPMNQVPGELLFQITLCGGATDDARRFYGQIVSEIETVVERYLSVPDATVADSLMATSRVYTLFVNVAPEDMQTEESPENEDKGEFAYEDKNASESALENEVRRDQQPRESRDVKDLFNAWNTLDEDEQEQDDVKAAEAFGGNDVPEQPLEPGDVAFAYDEWDRELGDYRVGWSRVVEKKVRQGDRTFVELTRSRYKGVISSVRSQFQMMKPENLTRVNREVDGEDYDLDALIDYVVDRRVDGHQSENIYVKRLRKQRDVAVSLLLDQSSSTARTITRNPLQPYTHPGRRIIEIEKEGLVLMSEALESVGDRYSIAGFTSEGRHNVKYYIVKDFHERYSEEVERRIGGISFQNNTRLGAAIRHSARKLLVQDTRTKLLIILTDGRPYDHDYGDARYAREDVREALTEAKMQGITPFCITIDRDSESEMKDLYGDVGYTIIDDVMTLPERMPGIYRRLTS